MRARFSEMIIIGMCKCCSREPAIIRIEFSKRKKQEMQRNRTSLDATNAAYNTWLDKACSYEDRKYSKRLQRS